MTAKLPAAKPSSSSGSTTVWLPSVSVVRLPLTVIGCNAASFSAVRSIVSPVWKPRMAPPTVPVCASVSVPVASMKSMLAAGEVTACRFITPPPPSTYSP